MIHALEGKQNAPKSFIIYYYLSNKIPKIRWLQLLTYWYLLAILVFLP